MRLEYFGFNDVLSTVHKTPYKAKSRVFLSWVDRGQMLNVQKTANFLVIQIQVSAIIIARKWPK